MKKKIGINIFLIILTNLSVILLSLILPFFFKWYELKLGESNEGAELVIFIISLITWVVNNYINGIIIDEKLQYNKSLEE